MVSVRRLGGMFIVGFFIAMTALRPLLRNPAVANASPSEILQWPQILLYLPLLAVTALVLALAVRSVVRGDGLPAGSRETAGKEPTSQPVENADDEVGFWEAEREKESVWEEESGDGQADTAEQYETHPAVSPDLFEADSSAGRIEDGTPDAELSEHLDHLETELGDDEALRDDLDTLEQVVEETDAGHEIPARCPRDGCEAVWAGRTMLGIRTDRYEVLDDGEEIVCLDCESIYRPEG